MSFGGAHLLDPGALFDQQRKQALMEQANGGNYNPANRGVDERLQQQKDYFEEEKGKGMITKMLQMMSAGGNGAGFGNVPAYNMHEAQGRGGLVDPSLTGQQTNMPAPFSRRYELAAQAAAEQGAIPAQLKQTSDGIVQAVNRTHPLAMKALNYPSTIYEQVPSNYMVNRLNIAKQRKREESIYGYAG